MIRTKDSYKGLEPRIKYLSNCMEIVFFLWISDKEQCLIRYTFLFRKNSVFLQCLCINTIEYKFFLYFTFFI